MNLLLKCISFALCSFIFQPFHIVVKYFDATNQNTLLSTVKFTYERETQRDSAFDDLVNYYNQAVENIGGFAFLDTTQNALIIIDRK